MKGGFCMRSTKRSAAARREQNWGYLMVAPTIIGLIVLNVWPFIQTIYASFCEHLGFGHYKFIGLDNYINMFQNADFWRATGNTPAVLYPDGAGGYLFSPVGRHVA